MNYTENPACPRCSKVLSRDDSASYCPDGHGYLLTSKSLRNLEDGRINEADYKANKARNAHARARCPVCSEKMKPVDYCLSGIIIDSCSKCHHRWLDAGEITGIKNRKSKLSVADHRLLMKLGTDSASKGKSLMPKDMPDYRLGLINARWSMRLSRLSIISRLGETGNLTNAIPSSGLFGAVLMLLHSNFSRILLLFLVLIFAGLFWYAINYLSS